MAIHPVADHGAQDRPVGAAVHGAVGRSSDRGCEWAEHDLAAFAAHSHDPVPVFVAEVGGSAGTVGRRT